MSGSGPTVFGLFDDRQKAVRAKEALEGRYRQTYLAGAGKNIGKDGIKPEFPCHDGGNGPHGAT